MSVDMKCKIEEGSSTLQMDDPADWDRLIWEALYLVPCK